MVTNAPPQQKAGPSAVDYFRLRPSGPEAPFCAIQIAPNANGSFGAPLISAKAEALDAEHNPVPGLYSAGTLANVEMFYLRYAVSGASLCMGTVTGRVAAQSAMEYLGLWDMWPGTLTDSRCNNRKWGAYPVSGGLPT